MGNDRTVWFPAFCQPLALCSPMPCSKSHVVMDVLGHLCWMACSCTLVAWGVFPSPRGNFQEPLGGFISCRVCNIWDLRGKTPTSHFFPLVFFFLTQKHTKRQRWWSFFLPRRGTPVQQAKAGMLRQGLTVKKHPGTQIWPLFWLENKAPFVLERFFWGRPSQKK